MPSLSAGIQLQQKLSNKLNIGPQMLQSLNLLAMNSVELERSINEYLESNPLLEHCPDNSELSNESKLGKEKDIIVAAEGVDDSWELLYNKNKRDSSEVNSEQQWRQTELSLHDRLHQQLECEPMESRARAIAIAIVDSLDDDGYFRADPMDIAILYKSGINEVSQVLCGIVQRLEPVGIAARDLTECLLLQLKDLDSDNEVVAIAEKLLLSDDSTLYESDNFLAVQLHCSVAIIAKARELLKHLDPSPGFNQVNPNIYIYPELYFSLRNGNIEVEVKRMNGSNIRLTEQWKHQQWLGADKDFINHAKKEADWLLQALSLRYETIVKVGLFLAEYQQDFLIYGTVSIKPLTLAMVAKACGVHESTVSRITNGKYAQTPLGLIELRHFFSAGIETRSGNMIAVAQVKRRIKHMIEKEPTAKALSDQAICKKLAHEGITIARRTVAKYREALGFASSSQRKKARALSI